MIASLKTLEQNEVVTQGVRLLRFTLFSRNAFHTESPWIWEDVANENFMRIRFLVCFAWFCHHLHSAMLKRWFLCKYTPISTDVANYIHLIL